MQTSPVLSTTILALLCVGATASANIALDFVPVGDPGNPNDTITSLDGSGLHFGGVNYTYFIGTYEVTLNQYTTFLNAVATTDTYSLYNTNMATDPTIAGIARSGSSGSYSYSVLGDGLRPVTAVSWFDAARFTNWLHNGQPVGLQTAATTEAGAYVLGGATSGVIAARTVGAQYWIPSENEWYKAAYYQPAGNGGDTDGYWLYPMKTNSEPYSDQPPGATPDNLRVGNFFNDDGIANGYNDGKALIGLETPTSNVLTPVGAYTSSIGYYGTYDQGGGVYEWNDTAMVFDSAGMRGGSWNDSVSDLQSDRRNRSGSATEYGTIGFRVAAVVPEPSIAVSFIIAGGLLLARRRRAV